MTGQRPGRRGARPRVFTKLYRAVRDTPVSFAMAVLETPSLRKRRISSSRPSGELDLQHGQLDAVITGLLFMAGMQHSGR